MIKVVKILNVIMLLIISNTMCYAQNRDTMDIIRSQYLNRPDKAATEYYMRGKETMILSGDVEKACKYFLKALEANPNHAAANYELSLIASPDKALDFALKAYQSDTTNYWYQDQLSDVYIELKDAPKAIEIGEQMIKYHKDDDDAYKKLASFYFYVNQVDKAMSLIDTIKTRFGMGPEIALFYSNMVRSVPEPTAIMLKTVSDYTALYSDIPHFSLALGDIYLRLGLEEQALIYYKRVKEIDPNDLRGDVALFDYYNRRRNQGEAIKYLSSLFKISEIDVEAKLSLYKEIISNNIYLYRNYFNHVNNAAMSLIIMYPKNMDVRMLYADHQIKKGDIEGALSFHKIGLESDLVSYESLQMIIEIEAYYKRTDSMSVYINKGLELFPDRKKDLNMNKIALYSMTKEFSKAIGVIKQEIKEEVNDSLLSIYHGVMGDIYHSDSKNKLAYKAYDKALKYDPSNIVVLNNYSYYLALEDKDLDKALLMALTVINKEPSNSIYIDTYAWVLYKLKRYKEAREVIAKAVALDTTKSSSLVLHYGDILNRLDQRSLAETYWLKAFEYGAEEKEITDRMGSEDPRLKIIKNKIKLNSE